MGDLQELGRRVEEELAAAEQRRRVQDDPWRRSIVEFQQRHEQYTTVADVSRDAECETLIVLSNLEILPVFFPFEGRAWLTVPLGRANDDAVAAWVDERLVCFVQTYLRVEAADQYDAKDLATDPVCGMRINRLYAAAQSEFDGQTYYFCLEDCLKKFVRDPRQYLAGVDLPISSRTASIPSGP